MSDTSPVNSEVVINRKSLCRVELIRELDHSIEIQIYHPINDDGTPDLSRKVEYHSLLTMNYLGQDGTYRFKIPGDNLPEVLDNFIATANAFAKSEFDKLDGQRTYALANSGMTIGESHPGKA